MELKSLTPDEFLKRVRGDAESLIHCLLERGDRHERREIRKSLGYDEKADEAIRSLSLRFREYIDAVYDREYYGQACQTILAEGRKQPVKFPLVDKVFDLVFDSGWGGHGMTMVELYNLHAGTDHGAVPTLSGEERIYSMYGVPGLSGDRIDPAREYIVSGYGYVISSVSHFINFGRPAFAISQKLFDRDALDEYDEAIMEGFDKKVAEDFFV